MVFFFRVSYSKTSAISLWMVQFRSFGVKTITSVPTVDMQDLLLIVVEPEGGLIEFQFVNSFFENL